MGRDKEGGTRRRRVHIVNWLVIEASMVMFGLTSREQEVAWLTINGYSVPEIASHLDTSIHTIRHHRQSVYRKTGAHGPIELLRVLNGHPPVVYSRQPYLEKERGTKEI